MKNTKGQIKINQIRCYLKEGLVPPIRGVKDSNFQSKMVSAAIEGDPEEDETHRSSFVHIITCKSAFTLFLSTPPKIRSRVSCRPTASVGTVDEDCILRLQFDDKFPCKIRDVSA